MNSNLTYIAILLDSSGSMGGSRNDVIGGVNSFLEQQRQLPGEARVTIAKFATNYEIVCDNIRLQDVKDITPEDYLPMGGTALADAAMRLISTLGGFFATMPEEERPGQVVVLVFSDGEENMSREHTMEQVRETVKHQEEKYSWKFLLFGMDIDAKAMGASLGMRGVNAHKSGGGVRRAVAASSAYVGYSRLGDHELAARIQDAADVDDRPGTQRHRGLRGHPQEAEGWWMSDYQPSDEHAEPPPEQRSLGVPSSLAGTGAGRAPRPMDGRARVRDSVPGRLCCCVRWLRHHRQASRPTERVLVRGRASQRRAPGW